MHGPMYTKKHVFPHVDYLMFRDLPRYTHVNAKTVPLISQLQPSSKFFPNR